MLTEKILHILPPLLRPLMKPAPLLHQLLPMISRLFRRHQPPRRNPILLYHLKNLRRQLTAQHLLSVLFLGLSGWAVFPEELEDLGWHVPGVGVGAENCFGPPVLLLGGNVAG